MLEIGFVVLAVSNALAFVLYERNRKAIRELAGVVSNLHDVCRYLAERRGPA